MAVRHVDLWNHWAAQILVLLSLALQVVLLLLAGIRRRGASVAPKFILWLAYQLADSTAIYTIGHLSFFTAAAADRHQQLVAFWAPFLLLHLGGPDNITAYALQDNELWLRHLQNLAVQILGVAYILYNHVAGDDSLFVLLAAFLMFGVGVVKYAERIRALRCGNLDSIRSSLKAPLPSRHHQFHALDLGRSIGVEPGDEFHERRAHSFFHVCKHALVDSWIVEDPEDPSVAMLKDLKYEKDYKAVWTLMEMELSLMYDLLYTKAGVIHTWSGYCIRVVSPLTVTASLLLLQFSGKYSDSGVVDVGVTYALLAGAMILETASLLRALASTWTYAFLCATRWSWLRYAALCTGRWHRLRRFVKTIPGRRSGTADVSERRWSGKIGQYNLLHFCSRRDRAYTPLLGRFARLLGLGEWWIRYHYSWTIDTPDFLKEKLFKYVLRSCKRRPLNPQGVIRLHWGQEALEMESKGLYEQFKFYSSSKLIGDILGVEFQEAIIIWHIGTDVFLANSSIIESADAGDDEANLVNAIKMISNYIFFLLVERPYMLPGLAQSTLYRRTSENLDDMWNKNHHSHPGDKLAEILYNEDPRYSYDQPRLSHANGVAKKLLAIKEKKEKDGSKAVLELLLNVWMDFLVYAANRCSRESHAKKLSDGGELTTILWLMTNHLHQGVYASKPEDTSSNMS